MGRKKKPKKEENISFMQNMDCDKLTILHAVDIVDTKKEEYFSTKKKRKISPCFITFKTFLQFSYFP